MNYDQKVKIGELLREKGAVKDCHRCGKNDFVILDRSEVSLPEEQKPFKSIPTILIGCEHCGYIFHHSLGLLGLNVEFGI